MNSAFNRQKIQIRTSAECASRELAAEIASAIRKKAQLGQSYTLGLATGSSPLPLYQEFIRLHREEGLSFQNVVTFNLDEYYGLPSDSPHSYAQFMRDELFSHLDIPPEQTHIPNGMLPSHEASQHCEQYEESIEQAGGIDFQILGIGRSGHIGFNEPPSALDSRTRLIKLATITRDDAAAGFGGVENVPQHALTMGIASILASRRIALLAWGKKKAPILNQLFTSSPTPYLPASFLTSHGEVTYWLDTEASSQLKSSSLKL